MLLKEETLKKIKAEAAIAVEMMIEVSMIGFGIAFGWKSASKIFGYIEKKLWNDRC
jgi:hypothetical protein